METYYNWLNTLVNKNKSDFGQWPDINWLNPYVAPEFQEQRDRLLSQIGPSVLFKGTKPYYGQISKGCTICGSGKWSCLFITNKCNAVCFYCPTSQKQDEPPSTQGLDFDTPQDYAEYVKRLGFKGVAFSGGEPFLYFDRLLAYLKAVRQTCDSDLYIWAYTNGMLATTDKLQQLADAGLDELRFDIGATGFGLDKVVLAKGIIPNITIEIPAVPEEMEHLISLLPQMVEAGVTNLNLHQLRLTPHNANKLVKRGYTVVHAERPIVLESELAALQIVDAARRQHLPLGINYCSFFFKNRFQKAGFRKLLTKALLPTAVVGQGGYVREFGHGTIRYKQLRLLPNLPDYVAAGALAVGAKEYPYVAETVLEETGLSTDTINRIQQLLYQEPVAPPDGLLFRIWQLEYIEPGLRHY